MKTARRCILHALVVVLGTGIGLKDGAEAALCAANTTFFTVESAADARLLAQAVNCSDGNFEVEWRGAHVASATLHVTNGTVLTIAASGAVPAVINANRTGRAFLVNKGVLILQNLTLTGGASDLKGGAISANNSLIVLENCRLTANNGFEGGAAYLAYSDVEVKGFTVFDRNTGFRGGGALSVTASNVRLSGEITFVHNEILEYTSGEGGAASFESSQVAMPANVTFIGNVGLTGGAVFVYGEDTFLNITGHTVFAENEAYYGGALAIMHATVHIGGFVTFSDNVATHHGGGVWVYNSGNISVAGDVLFSENAATGSGGAVVLYGGGILAFEANASVSFEHNMANSTGGAVAAVDGGHISGRAGAMSFHANSAGDLGGALYARSASEVHLYGGSGECSFVNNKAVNSGGALFVLDVASLYIEKATFVSNNATVGGAAVVYASYGSSEGSSENRYVANAADITSCLFRENQALGSGGALDLGPGTVKLEDVVFEGNTAGREGGAMSTSADISAIINCTFNMNTAPRGCAVANNGIVGTTKTLRFESNALICDDGQFIDFADPAANIASGDYSSGRYESDCVNCGLWSTCYNCTVVGDSRVPTCTEVPDHTTSPSPTGTLESLTLDEGYWRATNTTVTILECYVEDACTGGSDFGEYCAMGYTGAYCAVCQEGYSSGLSYTCSDCSRPGSILAASVSGAFLTIAAVIFITVLLDLVTLGPARTSDPSGRRCCGVARLKGAIRFHSLKIVVVAWQIIAQFSSVAGVAYPDIYEKFLAVVNLSNLDLTSILAVGCMVPSTFYHGLFVSTLGPLAALAVLLTTYNITILRNRGNHAIEQRIWKKHVNAALALAFLVYSHVSTTVFSMFACDDLDDGGSFLRADYSVRCDTEQHTRLQGYAAFMIMVYPIGIPFVLGVVLVSHRRALLGKTGDREEDPKLRPFADLWQPYRPEMYLYEMVAYLRRIVLTGIVVFIYPNTAAQIAVTMMLEFFFFLVSAFLLPYGNRFDTWLSHVSHTVVFMSLYVALLLKVDISEERDRSQQIFGMVLVLTHGLMLAAVVIEATLLLWHLKHEAGSELHSSSSRHIVDEAPAPLRRKPPSYSAFTAYSTYLEDDEESVSDVSEFHERGSYDRARPVTPSRSVVVSKFNTPPFE